MSEAVVSSSVLTFDSISDWEVESGSIAGTSAGTQGSGAVEFDPTGWGRLVSRSFSTSELTGVSDTLAFDVYIPDLPADFYWLGGMNLFIDCPAAGLWNVWAGYQALQILFDGEFNRVTYPLSPEVTNVLQQPSVQCSVALEISSNPAFGGFILDNGGFVQWVPMEFQLIVSALLSIGLLSSCSDEGFDAPDGAGGSTDAMGGQNPLDEVLPQGAYIVGSCRIPAGSRICTLHFGTPDTPQTEAIAYDDCRDVDDDVGFNEDWWSPRERCPTSVEYECRTNCPTSALESACVFVKRAEFEYSDHSQTLEEREHRCDIDGGEFYEF